MLNVNQAISWLSQGNAINLVEGGFEKSSTGEKIKNIFIPYREVTEISKIVDFVKYQLAFSSENRDVWLNLADRLIERYHRNSGTLKVIQAFERSVRSYQDHPRLMCKANKDAYQKWISYGMPADIFYKHPDFCLFLEKSYLLSQIKVTRDSISELEGEPAILVDGVLVKWSEFKNNFEIQHSYLHYEDFIVHKKSREVYTYLDNGLGLQQHHPFLTSLVPISKLNNSDLDAVSQKASEFIRPGENHFSSEERSLLNAERPHIIQLVTSFDKKSDSNFDELITNPKHPYIRIISGKDIPHLNIAKGDVFEIGYGWKQRVNIPFETIQGQFRSPDFWEYRTCDERLITNIPISRQEAIDLYEFTLRYHKDGTQLGNPVAFHLFRQNCSTYVRTALEVAGIQVPTEMTLSEVIQEVAPNWLRKVGQAFKDINETVRFSLRKVSKIILPASIKHVLYSAANKVERLFNKALVSLTAFGLAPLGVVLGGTMGEGGRAFAPNGNSEARIDPPLKNWKNWFNLSGYTINLPGVLQRWQREQASTVIYKKPIRLAIVP